ncbi:broad-complex core protein isoforms 1/2/3/4/5-like [Toxorhynchites rutilus septentrionalis]|uniref:broad-complex core protein isoforms 1/2/3/4/5-like n=1 Tax=Toxorhynchites rutilus septentrionalis TaxID=329112 RepID=UPI002479B646|nr:broad-complex core protein isoforms 1/2/3/4/5-like [Toxorhynchites rutilus septentrionalis]
MSSGQSQQFCVRWNSHLGSIGAAFPQLLAGQRFVDVTLACEGHQVHCHRLVLAACSTFFENLLGENPCKHPIIILPREIKLWAIQALVDFMYKGEVNVSQAGLPDLMKCAEILKIRGLCGSDAALNLNQINSPGSSGVAPGQTNEPSNQSGQRGNSPANAERSKGGQQNSALGGNKAGGNFLGSLNLQPVASSTPAKVSSQQQQQQPLPQSGDDGENSDGGSGNEMCIKTEDLIIDDDADKPGDDEEDMDNDTNGKTQAEEDVFVDDDELDDYIEDVDQDLQQLDEQTQEPPASNSNSNNNEFTITITGDNSNSNPTDSKTSQTKSKRNASSSPPPSSSSSLLSILTRGSIRVKSNENLFENYKQQQEHKNVDKSASRKHVYSCYGDGDDGDGGGGGGGSSGSVDGGTDSSTIGLPSSLVYNRNTMDIYVKPKKDDGGGASTASNPDISLEDAGSELSTDGYENIICSPNFSQISGKMMNSYQDDDYDDDFDIQIIPDDNSLMNGESEGGGDDEIVYPPPLLPYGNPETSITRVSFGKSMRTNGGPGLLKPLKQSRQSRGRGGRLLARLPRESSASRMPLANGAAIPPSAFVLRNPRGNQPRSYNTDALWSALMDVKAGESIYRASQIHKVPRKTLRNWMKRWDIKSAYPMPRQLKEAAEKKRIIKELTEQAQQLSDEPMQ